MIGHCGKFYPIQQDDHINNQSIMLADYLTILWFCIDKNKTLKNTSFKYFKGILGIRIIKYDKDTDFLKMLLIN